MNRSYAIIGILCAQTDELSITVIPLSQTANEKENVTFISTASGIKTKEFEYQWFKFERQKSLIVEWNRNISINNVRVEDEGLYYSCVRNEWNTTKCSLTVNLTISGK